MAWRLAKSLVVLRDQINQAYPNRSKASDGTIGDQSHASGASDHNPNANGVVCAMDITHSPQTGFDAHGLADHLRVNRHPNLRYLVSNRRIAGAWTNWNWTPYTGDNPHDKHIHVSVGEPNAQDGQSLSNYDNETKWSIGEDNVNTLLPEQGDLAYKIGFNSPPSQEEMAWLTAPDGATHALQTIFNNNLEFRTKAQNYDAHMKQKDDEIARLREQLALPPKDTKWEVFKALIKELFGR